MRILYLSPYFWPEEIGSAPYCTDLAAWLCDRGHEVGVIAFRPHYPSAEQFSDWADGSRDKDDLNGIPITRVRVGGRGGSGFKDRLKNDLAYLSHVLRCLIRGELRGTSVIVAYVPSTLTMYGAFAAKLFTGARIVAVVHDIESGLAKALGITNNPILSGAMKLAERIGLNRADHVVVLTDAMMKEIRDIGCKRPISVLSIWSAPASAWSPPAEGPAVLMYSGNFGKKQNLEQLIPLFRKLSSNNRNIRIVLRGDGQERERFEKQIGEAGVTGASFLPLAPASEFLASLQSAHIHVVPQAMNVANYALPSKVFSIMAAGRPFICIASPNSPLDELARRSGAGICVYSADDGSLYRAVVDLAGNPALQQSMGESGRRFVEEHMNRQTILQAYEDLICV
jgi:putative colanic acid biosynthesis glycosyltransferase WcaI